MKKLCLNKRIICIKCAIEKHSDHFINIIGIKDLDKLDKAPKIDHIN